MRAEINTKMQEGQQLTKSIEQLINDYENIQVNYTQNSDKEQKR